MSSEVQDLNAQELSAQEVQDKKRLNRLKVLWPAAELGGGFNKAYFSVYISYLYTNVYKMSAAYSGALSLIQLIIGWAGGPIFATFMDGFSFKKAKYWPWIMIGSTVVYSCWILLFSLPAVGISGSNIGLVALVLAVTISVFGPMSASPITAVYPQFSADAKDRQFFAQMQKLGRDGGKTVFGYIVPVMLAFFIASMGEINAYAIMAVIIGAISVFFYWALALFGLRGSYVERKAVERSRTATGERKKGIPITTVFKTIFANRALLSMYLFMTIHKGYYFIYTGGALYVFRYVFGSIGYMATFMLVFNLLAIIGVMFGPLWRAIFKETKRCFVSCMMVHVAITVVIAVMFKSLSATMFIVLFGASSFFMGMLENYIMPMFAASSDYGAWKTGSRLDGITMSIYGLTITSGSLIATIIRTAVLVAVNLDFVVGGGAISDAFIGGIGNLFSWFPAAMSIISLLVLIFLFNLNDKRIAQMNEDMKAGITAANSQYKF